MILPERWHTNDGQMLLYRKLKKAKGMPDKTTTIETQ
jgi:hypothetical protein